MKHRFTLLICLLTILGINQMQAADLGGTISSNTTLTVDNSPYIIINNVTVNPGITLTIEPGVEVRFNSNFYIHVRGTMNASEVIFTANTDTPVAGFYQGIYVGYQGYAEFADVSLNNCTVEYAQQMFVRKGSLTLTNNCTLQNFSGYGIDIYQNGTLDIDNTSVTSTSYPIYFRDTNGGNFTVGENVSLTGNTNDFIFIDFRDLDEVFNMPDVGIPYYYNSELRILESGQLNIEPGAVLEGNTGAYIAVNGIIKAIGTEASPVTFTTRVGNNYWLGMNINNASNDSECLLKNCILENATYDNRSYSALGIFDASPVIDSCIFRNNNYNVEIQGRSLPSFSNNSFGASIREYSYPYNISMDWNAEPSFSGDTLHFNNLEARAIGVIGNTVTSNSHLRKLNFVGIDNITYLLTADVTIDAAGSLDVDPGIVIKCNQHDWDIFANGPLTGIGSAEEPIVFTHQADDASGNPFDTYNNGSSTIGNSTSGRIFLNSTELSTLDNWIIKYAGYSNGYYGVYVRNNNILRNSDITNSYRAVYFGESAQIINNDFEDINYYPVSRYFNEGEPTLISNTINNVTCNGINLVGFATDTATLTPMNFAGYSNVAYVIESSKTIPTNAIVNVDPGTVIKFQNGAYLYIDGGLSANGTSGEKIIFTSIHDDSAAGDTNMNGTASAPSSGNWNGITFNAGSLDNINSITYADIRYLYYGLNINSCAVGIDNMLMNFSYRNGLLIYGDANPTISNSQFYNLGADPIHMDMFASPTFSNNTVANVPRIAISLRGQTVSGTVPIRSFAGIDTITYVLNEHMTINDHLIIPAGLTFKSNGDTRWYVNGRLDILGTADKPVVFTSYQDDAYGYPKDLEMNGLGTQYNRGSHIYYYDGSDDNSTISHAIFRYTYTNAVKCYNASPTIENCLFENFAQQGIYLNGLSTATVNNCTFNNIAYPLLTSLTSYPGSHTGNTISGSTGRGIRILDETQTQNVTVSKHDFAGITNIPYIIGDYTIGTSSVVTINPGVVFKFVPSGALRVHNGLIAVGTESEKIVFTASTDDFFGGDTYNDGDSNLPSRTHWYGIYFYNEAIDANCQMDYNIIKHASSTYYSWGAVNFDNSSPNISNCLFDNNHFGMISRNNSNPSITNCDFINFHPTQGYSIWNSTPEYTIDAPNCWWGDATGPYHATLNPDGLGKAVTDGVTFTPWNTILGSPVLGDVSLNGEIKPYDASLILQHDVGNITLTTQQQTVADVSGDASITAYDASLVLQYSIGLITNFNDIVAPMTMLKSGNPNLLTIEAEDIYPEGTVFNIPIRLSSSENVKAVGLKLKCNPAHLKLLNVTSDDISTGTMLASGFNMANGNINISMASAHSLDLNQSTILLQFELINPAVTLSKVTLIQVMANETNVEHYFDITVVPPVSTLVDKSEQEAVQVFFVDGNMMIQVPIGTSIPESTITITDLSGRTLHQWSSSQLDAGEYSYDIPGITDESSAILLITISNKEFSITKKVSAQ